MTARRNILYTASSGMDAYTFFRQVCVKSRGDSLPVFASFNDTLVRVDDDSTPKTLCAEYDRKRNPKT